LRLVLLLVLIVTLIGLLGYSQRGREPLVVSGFVEADEIRLGSRVGGRVRQVSVQEGETVQAGQVLVVLEPYDLLERQAEARSKQEAAAAELARLTAGFREEEIAEAQAQRDQLAARLDKLRTGPRKQEIASAAARLDAAQSQQRLAQQNYDRVTQLLRRGAATQEDMDRATEQLQAATATGIVREQELAELKEGTRPEEIREAEAQLRQADASWKLRTSGFRSEEKAQAKATLDAATAALESVNRQIDELEIKAPAQGIVEAIELQPGDMVAPGAPVLSLMDISRLWIRAYVPENRLQFQTGHPLEVTIDSFPDKRFQGVVSFISRQAEFTPSNVQTPEERSKQVFRIKVTLREGTDQLRPGMMGDVHLEATKR
jgi:multidrug resistance efflux pump